MGKNRSAGKVLESLKGFLTSIEEVPCCTFLSESGEWNDDVGVPINETLVKVTETQKELNILDILGFWPVQDCLDFVRGHLEALRTEDVTEIFNSIKMILTFVCVSVKSMSMELLEDFLDMFSVFFQVIRVDQDIIEIYNHEDVNHVREGVIHKILESSQSISKSERYN